MAAHYVVGIGLMLGFVAIAGIVQGNLWLVLTGVGGAAILVAMRRYLRPYLEQRLRRER
jgi:hypothetical protein